MRGFALPVALAGVLGALALFRSDNALTAATSTDRADYLIVAGASGQGDDQVIWILDTRAEELALVGWDNGTQGLRGLGTRQLSRDIAQVRQQR